MASPAPDGEGMGHQQDNEELLTNVGRWLHHEEGHIQSRQANRSPETRRPEWAAEGSAPPPASTSCWWVSRCSSVVSGGARHGDHLSQRKYGQHLIPSRPLPRIRLNLRMTPVRQTFHKSLRRFEKVYRRSLASNLILLSPIQSGPSSGWLRSHHAHSSRGSISSRSRSKMCSPSTNTCSVLVSNW